MGYYVRYKAYASEMADTLMLSPLAAGAHAWPERMWFVRMSQLLRSVAVQGVWIVSPVNSLSPSQGERGRQTDRQTEREILID